LLEEEALVAVAAKRRPHRSQMTKRPPREQR
jgi:hypothetical protein